MAAIEIKNISKIFGTFKAVDDLSFELEENRVLGFLGPNGAGKTTTLRLLPGLLKKQEGSISIFGKSLVKTGSIFFVRPVR